MKQHLEKLAYLRVLLLHLPDSVPFRDMSSTSYNFSVGEEDIIDLGDESSAVNRALEISFGDRSKTDGIVPIKEKGPGIAAVVDVLHECLAGDPSDARFSLWLENLSESAKEVYKAAGKEVSDRVYIMQIKRLTIN